MINFYQSMPDNIKTIVNAAREIKAGEKSTSLQSIKNMDITSLKDSNIPMYGGETEEEIKFLCEKSVSSGTATAAICVYPNQIANVKKHLKNNSIQIAVVNNFPHGDMSASDAATSAEEAIKAGATEIDTVVDYVALQAGNVETVKEKLNAVSKVCKKHNVKLKTILKASSYKTYDELYQAAEIAIECGADFVKTCTGKKAKAGFDHQELDDSTLETAVTVMQAVADSKNPAVGVKLSGGVKTPVDCEQMKYLSDTVLGKEFFKDNSRFRFGASSLLDNLVVFMDNNKTVQKCGCKNNY